MKSPIKMPTLEPRTYLFNSWASWTKRGRRASHGIPRASRDAVGMRELRARITDNGILSTNDRTGRWVIWVPDGRGRGGTLVSRKNHSLDDGAKFRGDFRTLRCRFVASFPKTGKECNDEIYVIFVFTRHASCTGDKRIPCCLLPDKTVQQ